MAEAVIEINKFDRGLPIPPRDLLLIDLQLPCARPSTCLKVLLPSSQQFATLASFDFVNLLIAYRYLDQVLLMPFLG